MNKRGVVDNFLNRAEFQGIYQALHHKQFPWYLSNEVSGEKERYSLSYYFVHILYQKYSPQSSFMDLVTPILKQLDVKAIGSIKANLYPHSSQIIKHGFHSDQPFDMKSFLFFVNDNNGVTTFQDTGEEIQSVANRGLFFNSHDPHCSSTCTDQKFRITINFNYF
jgi:hypothetical protein